MAHIFAFMTGQLVTEESAEFGDSAEAGYVDPKWSDEIFFDSRNDVTPVVSCDEADPNLADEIANALDGLGGYDDNGDGTFYGHYEHHDYMNGGLYTYALHFVRKSYDSRDGWIEEAYCPVLMVD